MAGANWTRKDCQAVAEMVGVMAKHMLLQHCCFVKDQIRIDHLIQMAVLSCEANAHLTINGNANFKKDRFIAECYKQAGLIQPGQHYTPSCPYCHRMISNREHDEQGACNDCYELHK